MNGIREYETKIFNKINPAVKFSVTRYVFAIGIFVAIVAFGLLSTSSLGVDQFPSINIPVVVVSTTYAGATPSVVDEQVTKVIENAVSSISGITDIQSSSQTGSSVVVIMFDQSTDKYSDTNQVSSQVSSSIGSLPSGASSPTIKTLDPNSSAVVYVGVTAEGVPLETVSDYVDNDLEPLIERVDGVADIETDGAPSNEFQVLLNPNQLSAFNISPQSVSSAIAKSAINTSIGSISHQKNVLTFSTRNIPTDPAAISNILVDAATGIRVGQVASVRIAPSVNSYARVNGTPMVLVGIKKTTDANTVAVVRNVENLMQKTRLPAGYTYTVSYDSTAAIKGSIQSTISELLRAGLVVAIIVLLFLGKLNTAIAVILAIPIALSASPILYKLCGFTFNLVSLLALISAIGIVVDDSIVVAENVERYRAMGFSLKESVLKGASEVFSAVVAASLSLLAVLIPVSFMGGFVGQYLAQFALGLAAAVAFSLFEALLFLTVRMAYTPDAKVFDWRDFAQSFGKMAESFNWALAHWRKGFFLVVGIGAALVLALTRHFVLLPILLFYPVILGVVYYVGRILLTFLQALTTTLHNWTESLIGFIRDAYVHSLDGILSKSRVVLLVVLGFLVVTVFFIFPHISFNFVPNSDNGYMNITLYLPTGTTIDETNEMTGRVEAFLLAQPEVQTLQAIVGSESFFSSSRYTYESSLTITLKPIDKRRSIFALMPVYQAKLLDIIHAEYPSGRLSVRAGGGPTGSTALQVNVTSANFDRLMAQDAAITKAIGEDKWVADVSSSLSDTSLENDFVPNIDRLSGSGLSPEDVSTALQTAVSGTEAANVQIGGSSYPIEVMIDPRYLSDNQSILNLPVYSSTLKTNLKVGQLGAFTLNQAATNMTRYNRIYYGQYTIDLKTGAPPTLEMQSLLEKELRAKGVLTGDLQLTEGSSTGAAGLARQLQGQAVTSFLLALFLVYLVMGAQFNSWRYPVYLLLPVPLALAGALWMVVFKGGGIDVFGLLGMLMLIGLSAKNAILYLDFVVERIGKMPFKQALIESAGLRFRPIVMTTLTILVTSLSLIFGGGQGSEFGQGLGLVTSGGIIFSAVLTFFVVPAAFYIFERKRVEATPKEADSNG